MKNTFHVHINLIDKWLRIVLPTELYIPYYRELSGRVLDSRPKGRLLEPHWHHCVVSLSKNINSNLVLVQPRKTRPYITE